RSGAHVYEPAASAMSFGSITLQADYAAGDTPQSTGLMKLDTYAEATKGKVALAGSQILRRGDGNILFYDATMTNTAMFTDVRSDGSTGGLFHVSYMQAGVPAASTNASVGRAVINTIPNANETIERPWDASTLVDPNLAWSRTEGRWSNKA
ncbi:MAG TPA: hypothetical protein PKV83_00150, partial [Methanothrix sp.]|nr:hypothetical protein [Methanothrix sp.]